MTKSKKSIAIHAIEAANQLFIGRWPMSKFVPTFEECAELGVRYGYTEDESVAFARTMHTRALKLAGV